MGTALTDSSAATFQRLLHRASPNLFHSRYQTRLPSNPQIISAANNKGVFSTLDLRKILANREVEAHPLSRLERFLQWISQRVFHGYSSTRLANDIRTNPSLAHILASCNHDFSLLGKLETYHPADEEDDSTSSAETYTHRVFIRPLLTVPDASPEHKAVIAAWEQRNVMIYDEWRFAGSIPHRTRVKDS